MPPWIGKLVVPPTSIDADVPPDALPTVEDFLSEIQTVHETVKMRGGSFGSQTETNFDTIKTVHQMYREPERPDFPNMECPLEDILRLLVCCGLRVIDEVARLGDLPNGTTIEIWHFITLARTSIVLAGAVLRLQQLGADDPMGWRQRAESAMRSTPGLCRAGGRLIQPVLSPAASRCLRYISLKHAEAEIKRAAIEVLEILGA